MHPFFNIAVLIQQLGNNHLPLDLSAKDSAAAATLFKLIKRSNQLPSVENARMELGLVDAPERFQEIMDMLQMTLLNGLAAVSNQVGGNKSPAQAKRYVWKLIAIAKRQSLVADSVLVIPYLKEAFRLAEYHAFTDAARVAIELLALLRANRYYDKCDYQRSRQKAMYYRELSRRLRQLKSGINHLDLLERDHPPLRTRQMAVLALRSEMEPFRKATNNFRFNLHYFAFQIKCQLLEEDFPGVIATAHRAITYCREQPPRFHDAVAPFVASLSLGLLHTDQPEEALSYAKQLLKVQEKSSLQYAKTIELIILLSFRSGNYQQAADYFTVLQKDLRTERWATFPLFAAYLMLLSKTGAIESMPGLARGSKRKIATYLEQAEANKAPLFQTVHFVILLFWADLLAGKYPECRARQSDLTSLANNLKLPRMKQFLHALGTIPEQAFHRVAVERHASKYLKLLQQHAPTARPLAEIIPLPQVWELIFQQLGTRRITARSPRKPSSV